MKIAQFYHEKCVASTVACKASYCRQVLQKRHSERDSNSYLPSSTTDSNLSERTSLDLHEGLFQFHQKLEYENANSDSSSDVNGNIRSSVNGTKARNRAIAKKKCVTCAKLGVTCMYDLEQQNRKPFWVEARSHFDGPSSKRQSDRVLSPDVFDGPRMHPEMRTQTRRYAYFDCSKVVRRDEFATHYLLMHNLIFEFQPQRCPMWATGCTFARSRLPSLSKLQLSFDSHMQGPKVCLELHGENSSQIYYRNTTNMLSKMPEHLMFFILERLDSLSLKYLSQTCHSLRYRVIEYAEQRDRGIVVSTWVPSEATEEQDDGNVTWKFCFLSHDNDHDDDTALVAEESAHVDEGNTAADLTFSSECFVPPNISSVQQIGTSSLGSCYCDMMTDSVALVNPQISRFCTYSGPSCSDEMRRHLECCNFFAERASYKEHMHYDLEGRIPLPIMR
ncbi:uncharacterized protein LOC142352149 isoform X3 [Convolutriloba macropyga]|uniref:uncharacterized protein LOC142352149 isoform X3 n=1 Tax=Convolutriloba macropyga TaxID=536237 RepID=UPI003F51EEDC